MQLRRALFQSTMLSGLVFAGFSAADPPPDLIVDDNTPYNVTGTEAFSTVWVGRTLGTQSISVLDANILNSANTTLGVESASDGNNAAVTGTWTNSGSFVLGQDGGNNALAIRDHGNLSVTSGMLVGANTGSNGNAVVISGEGSRLSVGNRIDIGPSGSYNSVTVEDGATLDVLMGSRIGGGTSSQSPSSNNSVTVTGQGSSMTLGGTFRIGDGTNHASSDNSLFVLDGGTVNLNAADRRTFIGYRSSDMNNSLIVSGVGSSYSARGTILVGTDDDGDSRFQPVNSLLEVSRGGRVSTTGNLAVGSTSTLRVGAGSTISAVDLVLQDGAMLDMEIDAQDTGSIVLSGSAHLDGTLATRFTGDTLLKSYTIIMASQDITGAFAAYTPTGLPGFFSSTLSYGPTEVTLRVAADFAAVPALTPNELAVGAALVGIINTPESAVFATLPEALSPLYALDASQLPKALNALSGESHASDQSLQLSGSLYSRRSLLGRLRQGTYAGQTDALALLSFGGPMVTSSTKGKGQALAPAKGTTSWAEIYGSQTDLDGNPGTSDVRSSFASVMTGADSRIENWLVGAAVGYTQTSTTINDLSSSSDVDSLLGALYAGTTVGSWNIRLGASHAWNQTETNRTITYPGYQEQASADHDSKTTQLFAELAYGLVVGSAAVEPFAGLAWVNVDADGFAEAGASAGLTVSSTSSSVTYSTLGVRAATSMDLSNGGVLQPRGSLAWQTASGDLSPSAQMAFLSAPTAGFTVGGAPLAENSALIEIGADLIISPQTQIGLVYFGQYADEVSNYGIQANVTWTF